MGFVQKSTRLPFMYGVIVCTVTIGTLFVSTSIDRNARNARIYDRSAAQKGARKLMETDLISDEAIDVLEHYPLQNDDYFYAYSDSASSENIARLENLVRFGQSSYIYESSLELDNADVQIANNGLLNPDENRDTEEQKLNDVKVDAHINQPNAENKQKITNQQQTKRDQSQITDHHNPEVKHQEPESQLVPAKQPAVPGKLQTTDHQQQQVQGNPPQSTNEIARKNSHSTNQKWTTDGKQQNTVQRNPENKPTNKQKVLADEPQKTRPQTSAKLQQNPVLHQQNDNSGTSSNQPESQPLQIAGNQEQKPIQQTPEKQLQVEEKEQMQTNQKTNTNLRAGSQQHIQRGTENDSEHPTGQLSGSNTGQQQNPSNPQPGDNEKTAPKDQSQYGNQQPVLENKPHDAAVQKSVDLRIDEQQTKNINLQGEIKRPVGIQQPQYPNKNEIDTQAQDITDKKQSTVNQVHNPNQQNLADSQRQSEGPLERVNKPAKTSKQKTNDMEQQETSSKQAGEIQPQSPNKNEADAQPPKQFAGNKPKNEQQSVSTRQIVDQKQTTGTQPQNANQRSIASYQQQPNNSPKTVNQPEKTIPVQHPQVQSKIKQEKAKENQKLPPTGVEQVTNIKVNNSSTEESDNCTAISFAPNGSLPLIGLLSFPGSGNTWTRLLIELATGIYTGSVYKDYALYKGGFRGELEAVGSGNTIVTKTHSFPMRPPVNFTKAILLIRNPFNAILSEYNRANGPHGINQSHISFADPEVFKGAKFSKFATGAADRWFDKIRTLLKGFKSSNRLIIYYESLKKDVTAPLERMLRFIGHPVDPERLQCTKRHADNPKFHRPKKSLGFNPFTEKVTKVINDNIQMARELINTYQLEPLPDYTKEKFK